MIKFLLAFLLAVPAYAGVILKETPPQNKRWVYDDGFIEIVLTDKQAEWCNGKYYLYVLTGNQKIDGCWEEQDSLVHVKYDSGYKFIVKAHKFVETKMKEGSTIKVKD
jgi:hypothetical protein